MGICLLPVAFLFLISGSAGRTFFKYHHIAKPRPVGCKFRKTLMHKLLFIFGLLLSSSIFGQERPNYLIKFYEQLQSTKFSDLTNIIANRADSQRINLLASNLDPKPNFADFVTIDNNLVSVNYADEKSVMDFKEKIKSVIIRKATFKTVADSIGQQIVWRTLIDISTKPTSDSIFHFSDTGIWLKIPAFISYKCFTIDTNGKFVNEILSHPAYHYPIAIRNMTREGIGVNNMLILYFFDDKTIQITFCKP